MKPLCAAQEDQTYRAFIERLKYLRARRRMTQRDLALVIGKPQSYVSKVERVERRLDIAEFRIWVLAMDHDPIAEFVQVSKGLLEAINDEDLLAGDA